MRIKFKLIIIFFVLAHGGITFSQLNRGLSENNKFDQTVKYTQVILSSLGYDPGPLDGIWGNKTQEALKNFQEDIGCKSSKTLGQNSF